MADELKKKFQEMQEAKHGKREELKIDEFEWIEVRLRILNYLAAEKTDFPQKPFSSTNNWRWTEILGRDIRRLRMRS